MALRQLQNVLTTLERLQAITIEQADTEAGVDAREDVNAAVEILQHWVRHRGGIYGCWKCKDELSRRHW